jgi:hypothetical protein
MTGSPVNLACVGLNGMKTLGRMVAQAGNGLPDGVCREDFIIYEGITAGWRVR